jgi:hypothetical protein
MPMNANGELRVGLLLRDQNSPVANVLLAHADQIRAPLSGIECEFHSEALLRANGPTPLERCYVVLSPSVEAIGADFNGPDLYRGVISPPTFLDGKAH